MGLVQNLKKTLIDWGDKILVATSLVYIKHLARQTLKKQDNSSSTESSPSPLTPADPSTTIATSSADTSEKTTMETVEIVNYVREWAAELVESKDGVDQIYDRLAIIDEYHEWFNFDDKDIEIVTLDEIKEEDYNDLVDFLKDEIDKD